MSSIETPVTSAQPLDEGLALVVPGRSLAAGAGWDWALAGWKLFARAPLMWVISMVLLVVIALAMSIVPLVGSLLFQLLQSVFAAGFVVACRSLERGGEFELEHLFAGFTRRFGSLLVIGALATLGSVVILLVLLAFVLVVILPGIDFGSYSSVMESIKSHGIAALLAILIALALMIPLMATYWFAPPLVVMHGMGPIEAMKASFSACFRNFMPMLVYGLVLLVPLIGAMITFGLGLLVFWPLLIASTYAAYRQIFTADEAAPVPARATML